MIMKRFNFFLMLFGCLLYMNWPPLCQAQSLHADTATYKRGVQKVDGYNAVSPGGLQYGSSIIFIGCDGVGSPKYRLFYEWNNLNNAIPAGSTIDSVAVFFLYQPILSNHYINIRYYNPGVDLDIASLDTLWNRLTWMPSIGEGQGFLYGQQGYSRDTVRSSFPANSVFVNSFNSSLSSGKFVLGIKAYTEGYAYKWSVNCSSVKLQVYYRSPIQMVTVDQKLANDSSYGSVGHFETNSFVPYSVPHTFALPVASTHYFQADTTVVNAAGINQKHNRWNQANTDPINYKSINIPSQPIGIIARLDTTVSATIENCIEGFSISNSGSITFTDPWFRDLSSSKGVVNRGVSAIEHSQPSPFTLGVSSNYKGVFLNRYQNPYDSNVPYYSISSPVGQTWGTSHHLYFQNWQASPSSSATFENEVNDITPVVFKATGATVQAVLKGSQLASTSSAIAGNNQRKIVSIPLSSSPWQSFFMVYESMGKVWLERGLLQTDGSISWDLLNGGCPLSTANAKSPSIDYVKLNGTNYLGITYQEKTTAGYNICFALLDPVSTVFEGYPSSQVIFSETAEAYDSYNAKPVIAWAPLVTYSSGNTLFIAWKRNSGSNNGYYYKAGELTSLDPNFTITWKAGTTTPQLITNTNANSYEASIAVSKERASNPLGDVNFHFCFRNQNSKIAYIPIAYSRHSLTITIPSAVIVDPNGLYATNTNPSMIAASNTGARICWRGHMLVDDGPTFFTVFADPGNPYYSWQYGWSSYYPSINKISEPLNDTLKKYYFSFWDDNDGESYILDNTLNWANVRSLGLTGADIQLSNGFYDAGSKYSDIRAVALQGNASNPYIFQTTPNFTNIPLNKSASANLSVARQGLVKGDSASFFFAVGDVTVNNSTIDFVDIRDAVALTNVQALNGFLETKPFALTDGANFTYGVRYGVVKDNNAGFALNGEQKVNFRIMLYDANSNELLGEYDNVTFDAQHVSQYNNLSYKVNTAGIGNRTVKLRLVVSNNFDSQYSITNIVAQHSALSKKSTKATNEISFKGGAVVKEYTLSQNYPNPFNPVTVINYQLPKAGRVTLRVYDMLGKEVVKLVDEEKSAGSYQAEFNAYHLSSGVYFYQLECNDFKSIKKMTLIK